jgi:hypothetical protein
MMGDTGVDFAREGMGGLEPRLDEENVLREDNERNPLEGESEGDESARAWRKFWSEGRGDGAGEQVAEPTELPRALSLPRSVP